MKDIQDLMKWINGCIRVIIDNKGDVFTTGKELGKLQVYLYELNKILNKPIMEEPKPVNDGVSHTYNLNKGEIVSVEVGGVKYLSPEEVLEKEKKAFEAARKEKANTYYCDIPQFIFRNKYPTFEDYKKENP